MMGLYEITDIGVHFKFYDYVYIYLGIYLERDSALTSSMMLLSLYIWLIFV